MIPLSHWPLESCTHIVGILTDIDDTLTTDGAITPDALAALADLKAAGLHVIPITGRPVGWSEPFAAAWPVDAIVAENGAVALLPGTLRATDSPGHECDIAIDHSEFTHLPQAAIDRRRWIMRATVQRRPSSPLPSRCSRPYITCSRTAPNTAIGASVTSTSKTVPRPFVTCSNGSSRLLKFSCSSHREPQTASQNTSQAIFSGLPRVQ